MIHSRPFLDPSLRQIVYDYDGYRCRNPNCGAGHPLTLDHIIPRVLGGPDTFENLQTLCAPCNTRKGCAPFILPQQEKKPKTPKPPGVNWRLHVPKVRPRARIPLKVRRLKRRRKWEMWAAKYPMAFTENQPTYASRERLRLRALV